MYGFDLNYQLNSTEKERVALERLDTMYSNTLKWYFEYNFRKVYEELMSWVADFSSQYLDVETKSYLYEYNLNSPQFTNVAPVINAVNFLQNGYVNIVGSNFINLRNLTFNNTISVDFSGGFNMPQLNVISILKKIRYYSFIDNINTLNQIILYDKNFKEILKSSYEIVSIYNPNTNIWKWSWSIANLEKKYTII